MSNFIEVKEGISGSIVHEIKIADSVDTYISEQITRICSDNPHLMKEVCSFALVTSNKLQLTDKHLKERLRIHMVSCSIMVYRMLESQADADKLNDLMA